MARRGFWSKLMLCGALTALVLTPAYATEESAQPAEKEKKPAPASETAKAEKPADAKAVDAAECKPGAARVNTLEDLFGISNWMTLQARAVKPAAPVTEIAWRDATAEAKPAKKVAEPATQD